MDLRDLEVLEAQVDQEGQVDHLDLVVQADQVVLSDQVDRVAHEDQVDRAGREDQLDHSDPAVQVDLSDPVGRVVQVDLEDQADQERPAPQVHRSVASPWALSCPFPNQEDHCLAWHCQEDNLPSGKLLKCLFHPLLRL